MDSESFFVEAYRLAGKAVDAWLMLEPQGLIVSIDIGGSFFDCIAVNAAPPSGHELVQSPSLLRYRSRLWDCQMPAKPSDVIDESVLFGRVDGWMRIVDDADLSKNYSRSAGTFGTRSIDAWIRGRSKLRLIHFGDRSLAWAQMEGAAETLARDRPMVTLYPPAGIERLALYSFLRKFGYEVFDAVAIPVEVDKAERPLDFGWIAVPVEARFTELRGRTWPTDDDAGIRMETADWGALNRNAMPRQRLSSDVFGLGRIALPETRRSLKMGDVAVCNDCYPLELDGDMSWRWLGPRPRSRMAIPCPFPGTYSFEATVTSCRVPDGLASCRVLVEGREVPTSVESCDGADSGTIGFVGHLTYDGYQGYVEVDFVSPGAPARAGTDTRVLRMNLTSMQVCRCP